MNQQQDMSDYWSNTAPEQASPTINLPNHVNMIQPGQPPQIPVQDENQVVPGFISKIRPNSGRGRSPVQYQGQGQPSWMPLAMVGIPCFTALTGLFMVTSAMTSPGSVQKASMEALAAVSMQATRERGDITCISWDCGKMLDSLEQQEALQAIQSKNLDIRWGDAQIGVSQPVQPAPSTEANSIATIQGNDAGGRGASIWQGDRVVNTIPNGDKVRIIEVNQGWASVEWLNAGGFIGWVPVGVLAQ